MALPRLQAGPWQALPLLLLLAACGEQPALEQTHFYAMGTRIELTRHASAGADDGLHDTVHSHFETFDRDWDAWGSGALATLNDRLAQDATATVPPVLREGLQQALTLGRESGGRFHPGMGRLVAAWGFHRQPRPDGPPPPPVTINALTATLPPVAAMPLDGNVLTVPAAGTALDLGGFAKGLSLDRLRERLRADGADDILVNAGGDLLALGAAPGENGARRAWHIGVLDPLGGDVLAGVDLRDGECVMTSGNYERRFEHDGEAFHHLLDPRTGRPAREAASVTVIHGDCARADAAATALFVADDTSWPAVARDMATPMVMRVTPDGTVELTPAMAERTHFPETPDTLTTRPLP